MFYKKINLIQVRVSISTRRKLHNLDPTQVSTRFGTCNLNAPKLNCKLVKKNEPCTLNLPTLKKKVFKSINRKHKRKLIHKTLKNKNKIASHRPCPNQKSFYTVDMLSKHNYWKRVFISHLKLWVRSYKHKKWGVKLTIWFLNIINQKIWVKWPSIEACNVMLKSSCWEL